MSALRRWVALVVVAVALLTPEVALACPVCFDPRDENRFAFLGTTIFLSLLPLGMVGAMVTWVRQRSRKLDQDEKTPVESTPR